MQTPEEKIDAFGVDDELEADLPPAWQQLSLGGTNAELLHRLRRQRPAREHAIELLSGLFQSFAGEALDPGIECQLPYDLYRQFVWPLAVVRQKPENGAVADGYTRGERVCWRDGRPEGCAFGEHPHLLRSASWLNVDLLDRQCRQRRMPVPVQALEQLDIAIAHVRGDQGRRHIGTFILPKQLKQLL